MHAVGLPELIAREEQDYFSLALTLATQPGRLAACKAKLSRNRMSAPLFDVTSYAVALEYLYETMWACCRAGQPRAAIAACETSDHGAKFDPGVDRL
ncbi:O-linked N-acetylglucosamine transferase family protein [Novosphingobium beihaiensis]|uniref:O-GlcNAc transferase C-terminal domain-containing protein n=1 Tax=Novosphingobium beihaiensis TaxID=2930389 RepID=A0ABT0BPL2_9SPHN|nr:hypothetical protein [Novosphingobium beihaiensis]